MFGLFSRIGGSLWRYVGGPLVARDARATAAAARRIRTTLFAQEPDGEGSTSEDAARFGEALERFALSDADLGRIHRAQAVRFYLFTGAALFAASFGTTSAYLTFGAPIALLAALMALLFLLVGAQGGLRAWQVRERRLSSFGEWLHTPRAWLPPMFQKQGEL